MAYKDYENLDTTKETVLEEKKGSVNKTKREYIFDWREALLCMILAIIPTVITMILYSRILPVGLGYLSIPYYCMYVMMTLNIYNLIKKKEKRESIFYLIYSIDLWISITSFLILIISSLGIIMLNVIVNIILAVITIVTLILLIIMSTIGIVILDNEIN